DGIDVSGLTDGPLTIDVVATDNNGSPVNDSTSAELDAVDAALSVNATVNHQNATLDIEGQSLDLPAGSTVSISISDQNGNVVTVVATLAADGSYSIAGVDVSGLADGELTVTATATDNNGNTVNATTNADLDTTPPVLTVDAPDSNDTTPTITGTSDEIGATVTIVVKDAAGNEQTLTAVVLADGTWSAEVNSSLAEGVYQVDARVSDAVGNVTTAETTGEIDLTPPLIEFDDLPTNTNNTMPDISGTSDEKGATVTVTVTDENGVEQTVTGVVQSDGTWSVSLVRPLAVGNYTAKATVSDAVGNTATAQAEAPGVIVPSIAISNFELKEEAGIEVTQLIWEGGLSTSQFGVTTNLANTNNGVTGRLTNNDVNRTRNLSITSVDGSNTTALMAVGDTYLVSWQTVNAAGHVNGNFEVEMTVTRSDYFSFTGEARDILVLQGTVNGNLYSVVVDSNGVQTGSYGWFGWSGNEYLINDLYDTDVGFREFIVNGQGAANSSVVLSQIDENGVETQLGSTTTDANGNWNFELGALIGRTGELKVVGVDEFGNESVDVKSFIFGETNISNSLEGTGDSDLIVGGLQDDEITGGGGNDVLIGGGGNDTFIWNDGHEGTINIPAVDTIQDFSLGNFANDSEADRLDLSDLLVGESPSNINDYIIAAEDGNGNTILYISSEGGLAGDSANANQLIQLSDVSMSGGSSADFIQALLNNGQLIIDSGISGTNSHDENQNVNSSDSYVK
ncbi:beta strand repeat-containing protein, partial [Aliidiomarina quisquiliarum]|uniref:beta strand repeat-containing protein n=1 Tax=Aliidiomarina quisquiliarum TaxID=2938947 RepID=UPI00208E90C7